MTHEDTMPELLTAYVTSAAGPFAAGDAISIAFVDACVARVQRHEARPQAPGERPGALVPDVMIVCATSDAGPYRRDDLLSLSFVDPRFARIQHVAQTPPVARREPPARASDVEEVRIPLTRASSGEPAHPTTEAAGCGVRVHLFWSTDRARRFVAVVDKLFTVDRLGWYRHVLAMRLLVPDKIVCPDDRATDAAANVLQTLRAGAVETLGRPLLAAYMPAFSVTAEWLETVETATISNELSRLREIMLPHAGHAQTIAESELQPSIASGLISHDEWSGMSATGSAAMLSALIPRQSLHSAVAASLSAYRTTLLDVFGQMAAANQSVRISRMAETNHALDDRLWQLVGTVGMTLDGLAVA